MSIENSFLNQPEKSPIPQGVSEDHFWDVVGILANEKPAGGERYKTGDIDAWNAARTKSGEYAPHMEEVIAKAQKEVLDPNSQYFESTFKEEKERAERNIGEPGKRKSLGIAYNQEFDPNQTHATLDGEETRLD